MTRSYRKTPACGITTARSEKEDKRRWHGCLRSKVKQILHSDFTVEVLPEDKDVSDPWGMAKDGRQYFDPNKWPKGLRK
jgi:hypothetical protein